MPNKFNNIKIIMNYIKTISRLYKTKNCRMVEISAEIS